ncbi:MAG: DsbA family protein, partial [bacterium]|nr:DsbA family protein [bacterium]
EVIVVEFIDFKCPNTLKEEPILKRVLAKYGSKMKLIVRDFPAESIHPGANQLALIGSCAYQQGLYWPMHNWFFANHADLPEKMTDDDILNVAEKVGADAGKLADCMKKNITGTEVNHDYADGIRFGVQGTPTFFINGKHFEGAIPFEVWENFFKKIK